MNTTVLILSALLNLLPAGDAFLRPLQQRDSILVADQLAYGFRLDSVQAGTFVGLPDFSAASNDTLTLVRTWQLDTTWQPERFPLFTCKTAARAISSIRWRVC